MFTSGLIKPDTPVAQAGDTEWKPVSTVVQSVPPHVIPPPHIPSQTGGHSDTLLSIVLDLFKGLSPQVKKAVLFGLVLLVILVVSSFFGDSSGTAGSSARTGDDRFWEDQAERLAQEATGGSNYCARCGGTGQIATSGRAINWNAHPDPSERLRAGADPSRCRSCSGQGTIQTQSGYVVACPDCAGRGQASSRVCDGCGGSGRWR